MKQTDKPAYNQGFHDAYYGRPVAPALSGRALTGSALMAYEEGYADGDRARPMVTVITTRLGPARIPNCTLVQARRMMVDL